MEFFRVGYYVYTSYTSQENIENEPPEIIIEDISRQIFNNKPRITRFEIDWKGLQNNTNPEQGQGIKEYMFQEQ
jgi:histone chaperone ASF1